MTSYELKDNNNKNYQKNKNETNFGSIELTQNKSNWKLLLKTSLAEKRRVSVMEINDLSRLWISKIVWSVQLSFQ